MKRVNKRVRAAVVERAAGCCERCWFWLGDDGHLDHFFGRKNAPETISTCWYLCPKCDDAKTTNNPSARRWVELFIVHCGLNGYGAEAERASVRLDVLRAKGF